MRARRLSQLGTADELGAATYFESAVFAELRGLVSTGSTSHVPNSTHKCI